eukprot:TRINITY_DN6277_c0_g1_i1.p1 TRINITY_DN6277_c0_g1~~TRINITY_DN6277_c0_g1_i1.p1  ORF type:complete len:109 (-),score=14.40 TRINITY_DN6277_c0_g1_i1:25-351(-)
MVFDIDVEPDVIVDRLADRRVHPDSGRTYHLKYKPPLVEGKDDITGEDLVQRDDDKPDTILARLATFDEETKPLLDYYEHQGILHKIPSPNSDVGYAKIKQILKSVQS